MKQDGIRGSVQSEDKADKRCKTGSPVGDCLFCGVHRPRFSTGMKVCRSLPADGIFILRRHTDPARRREAYYE